MDSVLGSVLESILTADLGAYSQAGWEYGITGKNDLTRRVTHREAIFGTVIHSIFDTWHYDALCVD